MKIDIAYGGSCTGGKKADMDMYASVLADAVKKGKRVADGVHLYIQFGSQDIRRYAEAKGYLDVFEAAGAELVDPSCGACIKAGPGRQRFAGAGHGERDQPQFPGPQRSGQGLPREPARDRGERDRRPYRRPRSGVVEEAAMKTIQPNARVVLEYTLKDDKGEVLDSSDAEDGEPIATCTATGCWYPASRRRSSGSR